MKMLENLIEKHGIITLVIIYLSVNLMYKNILNLVLLVSLALFSYPFFINKNNVIMFALVGSLLLGIYRNFHLLENFDEHKNNIKITNKLFKSIPSSKIKKVDIKPRDLKRTLPENKAEILKLKSELESGYSTIEEYPIFISSDNYIIQGHILHSLLKKYPEMNNNSVKIYKINEPFDKIISKVPMIKLYASVDEKDYNKLDISKIVAARR